MRVIYRTNMRTSYMAGRDALDGLIQRGESLSDVLKNVAADLAYAALQAALSGSGPLANLFGTAGGGLVETFVDTLFSSGTTAAARLDPATIELSVPQAQAIPTAISTSANLAAQDDLAASSLPRVTDDLAAPQAIRSQTQAQTSLPAADTSEQNTGVIRVIPSREFLVELEQKQTGNMKLMLEDYDREVAQQTARRALDDHRRDG